jgi:hypothetical protein
LTTETVLDEKERNEMSNKLDEIVSEHENLEEGKPIKIEEIEITSELIENIPKSKEKITPHFSEEEEPTNEKEKDQHENTKKAEIKENEERISEELTLAEGEKPKSKLTNKNKEKSSLNVLDNCNSKLEDQGKHLEDELNNLKAKLKEADQANKKMKKKYNNKKGVIKKLLNMQIDADKERRKMEKELQETKETLREMAEEEQKLNDEKADLLVKMRSIRHLKIDKIKEFKENPKQSKATESLIRELSENPELQSTSNDNTDSEEDMDSLLRNKGPRPSGPEDSAKSKPPIVPPALRNVKKHLEKRRHSLFSKQQSDDVVGEGNHSNRDSKRDDAGASGPVQRPFSARKVVDHPAEALVKKAIALFQKKKERYYAKSCSKRMLVKFISHIYTDLMGIYKESLGELGNPLKIKKNLVSFFGKCGLFFYSVFMRMRICFRLMGMG